MANTIQLKRSSAAGVVPSAGSLVAGELAVNTADGKLYTKKDDGTVVAIGGGGGLPAGLITSGPNAGLSSPDWLKCDGSVYAKSTYPALGTILGDAYDITIANFPASGTWGAIKHNGSIFCAVLNGSTVSAVSSNGTSWTQGTLPSAVGTTNTGMAWNGSLFCVPVYNSLTLFTSPDGLTWTSRSLPQVANWSQVVWNGSVFCVIAFGAAFCATSPDGITWTQRSMPATSNWSGLAWNGSIFCATSSGSTVAATSPDGITWTQRTLAANSYSVAWNGSLFFSSGSGGTSCYSSDGITWTLTYLPSGANSRQMAVLGNRFCVPILSGTTAFISTDAISWSTIPIGVTQSASGMSANSTSFLMSGSGTALSLLKANSTSFRVPAITTNTGGFSSGYPGSYYIKT